jgi:UrcA family protein
MYTRGAHIFAKSVAGAVTILGPLLAGEVAAKDYDVKVAVHVSTGGLDLQQPAGAQMLYERIQHAANVACTHGNRVDLRPARNLVGCREQAVGDAIRLVNSPLLTHVYLQTHTSRQAAAHGIAVPEQVAAN